MNIYLVENGYRMCTRIAKHRLLRYLEAYLSFLP